MNCYTRNGIAILNDITKDLKNLNELGIYLAKQTNIDAIKSLKLLILAADNARLDKEFDIDRLKHIPKNLKMVSIKEMNQLLVIYLGILKISD